MKLMNKEEKVYSIRIAGRDYTIRSNDAPDHVRRLAVFTDRKISETIKTSFINREDAAVVTALSMADELLNVQDEVTRLRRENYLLKQAESLRDAPPAKQ